MFIEGTTLRTTVRSILAWLARLSMSVARRTPARFLPITPDVFAKQVIYDHEARKFLSCVVRNATDIGTLGQIFLTEDYGTRKLRRHDEITAFYNAICRSGAQPLILDCGGNIGLASRYFAETYERARIVCVEPDTANVVQAKLNNSSPNIAFVQAAIGSTSGRGELLDPGIGCNGYRITASRSGTTTIVSIGDLVAKHAGGNIVPFIAKIDIEGFEEDLFSKNLAWVDTFPLLIIELHDWMLPRSANSRNFLKAIASLDRDFVYSGENVFSLSNTLLPRISAAPEVVAR